MKHHKIASTICCFQNLLAFFIARQPVTAKHLSTTRIVSPRREQVNCHRYSISPSGYRRSQGLTTQYARSLISASMSQVLTDEERARQSVSISTYDGRASTLYEEHESHIASYAQGYDGCANGNGSTDDEAKGREAPVPPRPAYEKLAQRNPKPTDHLSITLGPPMIILFDIVVPCIIYYVWYNIHRSQWEDECRTYTARGATCPIIQPEYDDHILGYTVASFGVGELYILIARVARLVLHREDCAPLLSRSKLELDATSWVYGVSMIMALIPFVIGSTKEIPQLYLYSPGFLMAFLGIIMLVTLIPVKIPIGINSHARGTRMRPFICM